MSAAALVLGSGRAGARESSGDPSIVSPVSPKDLHAMTFNVRYAGGDPSPNTWPERRPIVRKLLRRTAPDVIGTQEALYEQVLDIEADLPPHYDWIGVGRDDGEKAGEFAAVFFDTHRLEALEHGHFWLSDTPEVPGSRSWGNNVIRMVTWVRFLHSPPGEEGGELVFFNTHFDHQSENSRQRSAALVLERINEFDPALPVVLVGDFNAAAGASRPYEILVDEGGLLDTWEMARERGEEYGTAPGGYRDPVPGGPRIDWILTRGPVGTESAEIITYNEKGRYPSDHFPVHAHLRLGEAADGVYVTGIGVDGMLVGAGPHPVQISLENRTDEPAPVTVTPVVPEGWTAEPASATLAPGEAATITASVVHPIGAPSLGTLRLDVSAGDAAVYGGLRDADLASVPSGEDLVLALDAGGATSPLLPTYQRLATGDRWDEARGFGWVADAPAFRDRGGPDALRRDFALGRAPGDYVLRVSVPAGRHAVYALTGDASFESGRTEISADGVPVASSGEGTITQGGFRWMEFELDGGPSGRAVDLGLTGSLRDGYWRLNALLIAP